MAKEGLWGTKHRVEREPQVLFRGSLGVDFISVEDDDGTKHCLCIEINGHDSGVAGLTEIPGLDKETRRTAKRRMQRINKDYPPSVQEALNTVEAQEKDPIIRERKSQSIILAARRDGTFKNAHRNPDALYAITEDKAQHENYIPEEHRIRTWHPGDETCSRFGFWVVKARVGWGGKYVHIVSDAELEQLVAKGQVPEEFYIAQEYVTALPAETAEDSPHQSNTASMRLLVDFSVSDTLEIHPELILGYQRVSAHHPSSWWNKNKSDAVLVNKNTGALSYPASDQEMALATEAVEKIINTIAHAHREDFEQERHEMAVAK